MGLWLAGPVHTRVEAPNVAIRTRMTPFRRSGTIPHLLLLSPGSLPVGLFSKVGLSPAQGTPPLWRYTGRYPPGVTGAPSLALIMVPVQMPLRKSPTKILRKACGGSGHLLAGPIEALWRRSSRDQHQLQVCNGWNNAYQLIQILK
jgi:hypothetical protein